MYNIVCSFENTFIILRLQKNNNHFHQKTSKFDECIFFTFDFDPAVM